MNHSIILLAGKGTRIHSDVPKQFIEINGKPLFVYCVETFCQCDKVDSIVLVTSSDSINVVNNFVEKYHLTKVKAVVIGGETRQESALNGLLSLNAKEDDVVLIHDAARALVDNRIILDNIKLCQKYNAVVTAIKANDSVALGKQFISSYLNRDEVNIIQTPQTFKFSLIKEAHLAYRETSVTDDAALIKLMGKEIYFVEGSKLNFKITTDEDLKLVQGLLK